ncbi:unannotated protein [freshwater metagenome]|uniref:Unannotated protein n=1 Tax=freshwater metagenome TaxID=449393 RepID=A0A6J7FV09_9ZZZZ
MTLVSTSHLKRHLERWLDGPPLVRPRFLIHGEWPAERPTELVAFGHTVDVVSCPSELSVREELVRDRPDDRPLVMVTPIDRVGSDVIARLTKRRMISLLPAAAMLQTFGVSSAEARVTDDRWLVDALVESAPPGGYSRTGARQLTYDRAWTELLHARYGIAIGDGLDDLLRWAQTDAAGTVAGLPAEEFETLSDRLSTLAPGSRGILSAVRHGFGNRAVELGILAGVLADAPAGDDRGASRSRFGQALGGLAFDEDDARTWAAASGRILTEALSSEESSAIARLTNVADLVAQVGAESLVGRHPLLIAGLDQRLDDLAAALATWRRRPTPAGLDEVEAAADVVREHRLAGRRGADVLATMAVRLVRWLRTEEPDGPTFAAAAQSYAEGAAYADWARIDLRERGSTGRLGGEITKLLRVVDERRAREERLFSASLASWTAHAAPTDELMGVEHVLDRVVAPLASGRPVLLIVLDGLSHRVAARLREDLARTDWVEVRRAQHRHRPSVVSVLPSVTTHSRTSLLTGSLKTGGQSDEKTGFREHPALTATGSAARAPELFHKADLTAGHGGLAPPVLEAIAGGGRVVGAVVNAIDDHLSRDDQLTAPWSVTHIRPLEKLLDAARDAGRLVVVASDHGHVLERDGTKRPTGGEDGERWRSASTAADDGEVFVEGPRVLAPGGRAVLAVDEQIRYVPRKHGYHGGGSAQETLAPLLVLRTIGATNPDSWTEAPYDPPQWWLGAAVPEVAVTPDPALAPAIVESAPAAASIFDLLSTDATWIDGLIDSPRFAEQRRRAGRASLPEERVRLILRALDAQHGRASSAALARATGIPPTRLPGAVAALRQLLNVEGYAVLTTDDEASTVVLDRALLETQFELETS